MADESTGRQPSASLNIDETLLKSIKKGSNEAPSATSTPSSFASFLNNNLAIILIIIAIVLLIGGVLLFYFNKQVSPIESEEFNKVDKNRIQQADEIQQAESYSHQPVVKIKSPLTRRKKIVIQEEVSDTEDEVNEVNESDEDLLQPDNEVNKRDLVADDLNDDDRIVSIENFNDDE